MQEEKKQKLKDKIIDAICLTIVCIIFGAIMLWAMLWVVGIDLISGDFISNSATNDLI